MATKIWEVTKVHACKLSGRVVAFETELLYPADQLPDPPRVVAHRCSNATRCTMSYRLTCAYGTNLGNPDNSIYKTT